MKNSLRIIALAGLTAIAAGCGDSKQETRPTKYNVYVSERPGKSPHIMVESEKEGIIYDNENRQLIRTSSSVHVEHYPLPEKIK